MTVQWLDVLVHSTVLGLHVLGAAAAEGADLQATGEYYLVLWRQVAGVLDAVLRAEHEIDVNTKARCASPFSRIARVPYI